MQLIDVEPRWDADEAVLDDLQAEIKRIIRERKAIGDNQVANRERRREIHLRYG